MPVWTGSQVPPLHSGDLFSAIVLGSPEWLIPALLLCVLALVFVINGYRGFSRHNQPVLVLAGFLKAIACLLCAAILVEPLWTGNRPKPGANLFLVVADDSQGMRIRDHGQNQTRGELLKKTLTNDRAPWLTRLQQDFQVRRYTFGQRVQRTDNFMDLAFDETSSSLANALVSLGDRFKGRPVAGVLLFTDGNATDISSVADLPLKDLPPIHTVLTGSEQAVADLGVERLSVSESGFEDSPVSVDVELKASGFEGGNVVAELCKLDGTVVGEHTHEIREPEQAFKVRFRVRPEKPGVSFYQVRVYEKGRKEELEQQISKKEATLANNQELLAVDRGEGPYRILYVAGRPNWEFKFLRRSLEEDPQLDLVALIRIAKREAKFDFRGRAGESSNSLFRGFDGKGDEEAEQYDEPVLIRLNVHNDQELRDGFPKTAEQLYGYHAIVLDDIEGEFFTHDQLKLIHDFVSDRGGSLLMLGGQESFANGNFDRTPVGDVLPVYLDRVPSASVGSDMKLSLTREGWLQPWARLRDNEQDERRRLEQMPTFHTVNAVRGIKPGASVIASVSGPDGEARPALVVQRFGHGKSAALTVGDMWRWGIRQEPENRDLSKAWRQVARWMVADVPERVELELQNQHQSIDQAVRLIVRTVDEKFQPLDNSQVLFEVTGPDNEKLELTAAPSTQEAGVYYADYIPRQQGVFQVKATVNDADNQKQLGVRHSGWVSNPAAEEFRRVQPNRTLVEELASATGGKVITVDELDDFVKDLPAGHVPVTEQWASPLWHRPSLLLLVVACLAAEWGLRRWRGLA